MQNNLVECKDESKKNIKNVRDEGLDKFYTNVDYAKKCIDKLFELYDKSEFNLVIEPSAGNGSFFNQLDFADKIGIDILPDESLHDTNIIKMDFFDYKPHEDATNILVIGNPPFGRVSSIAIKFFNHAALFADFIAFIIPRTFRKLSVQNRLNNRFHLMYDEDVPIKPCIFTPKMTVKCCFQIWKKSDVVREVIKLPTTNVSGISSYISKKSFIEFINLSFDQLLANSILNSEQININSFLINLCKTFLMLSDELFGFCLEIFNIIFFSINFFR